MPLFLQTARHSTESCPMHNEKVKKAFSDFTNKMGKLAKKHRIKVVGAWASMPEHLTVIVYDVPARAGTTARTGEENAVLAKTTMSDAKIREAFALFNHFHRLFVDRC